MGSYESWRPQPPVSFPVSGPPVCVALGAPSYPGYMRPVQDERVAESQFMELNKDIHHATTPAEKFYLEPSKDHPGLLHVRCRLTKNYWVPLQLREGGPWFVCSSAEQPEEDLGKPSCTLFDFRPDANAKHDDGTVVRIFHPQHKKYASVCFMSGPKRGKTYMKLRDDQEAASSLNMFSVRRLSDQKELPRYIAFKGANGMYLALKEPYLTQSVSYLKFISTDITDSSVVHETFTDEYGVVRIRSIASGRFWTLRGNYKISAESGDPAVTKDASALFKVVMKEDNCIALQNILNGKFCKRLNDQGIDWLSASVADTNIEEAKIFFEEPIQSREIYDVVYHVGGKKSATNKDPELRNITRDNMRPDTTDTAIDEIELLDRTEGTWNLHLQADASIKTQLKASVPWKIFNFEAGIEGHFSFHGEYNSQKVTIKERIRTIKYTFPVPPMTRVTCSIYTRKYVVDVPFSYKQKVVLFNGQTAPPHQFYDGIYRGVTSYDADIDVYEEKITDGEIDKSSVI